MCDLAAVRDHRPSNAPEARSDDHERDATTRPGQWRAGVQRDQAGRFRGRGHPGRRSGLADVTRHGEARTPRRAGGNLLCGEQRQRARGRPLVLLRPAV